MPTNEEYRAYPGGHCARLWASLDDIWICPGCKRSKRQLMEYKAGKSYHGVKTPVAWRAALHRHHDHRIELGLRARFIEETICGPCNSADGLAKRQLRLPLWFSFAPQEIMYFVRPTANGLHFVGLDQALEAWLVESPPLIAEVDNVLLTSGAKT
jgi:hypothetical protein